MQGAALREAGIPVDYTALDVAPHALDTTVSALRADGAAGNVTIPHKRAFAALCDEVTDVARDAGAVNTWWTDGDRLIGDNTDVAGFDAAARALVGTAWPPRRVALIGAGGAAAAVAIATRAWTGTKLVMWARRPEMAVAFAQRFAHARAEATAHDAIGSADLVVNATPIGLHDDTLPIELGALARDAAVLDLVYRPDETALVRAARARGHRAADGMAMLVEQGAAAFTRWFGVEPDRSVMWQALGRQQPTAIAP